MTVILGWVGWLLLRARTVMKHTMAGPSLFLSKLTVFVVFGAAMAVLTSHIYAHYFAYLF